MTARIDAPFKLAPEAIKAMMALEASFSRTTLEPALRELVKMRASQINGCAFCLHMHAADARKQGESEMRLHLLAGWREAPFYTDRERAALAWTEALTRIAETGAPDADYAQLSAVFSAEEQVQLTLLIGAINTWNRLQIGFRVTPAIEPVRAAG
ncbi:alkyl hydroperoxide reductase AhpD [Azorhizobium oxalatiphilum]|uniref:Alkyl hydroperoxide reductase AhpD n=1 Tax=Azorhizobium oxalatiphilum TaxID=980631 RepID=A0A917CFR6_9HYPH|nr:carboxymuconolactone decarboxylase family protein [Azorhizobium oxalatiphilum]GGF87562.1 alkyl hydroperoxide reductase AhpD [Azorhizobium oxalatiphilum]